MNHLPIKVNFCHIFTIASFLIAGSAQIPLKSISNNNTNILIVCLDIDSSRVSLNQRYQVESFDDECFCIAHLSSITDKRVYFIVSASIGEYIVPLIYQHRCVEHVYVFSSDDEQQKALWLTEIPKIGKCWANIDELNAALYKDIQAVLSQPLPRLGTESITRCHTQTLVDLSTRSFIPLNVLNAKNHSLSNDRIRIVVLHCDEDILFHATSSRFSLDIFSNIAECKQSLEATDVKSVFFIISGKIENIMCNLETINMLKQIYTIYVFIQSIEQEGLDETILNYKNVSGLFNSVAAIVSRLTEDIKFYLEQSLYTRILSVFAAQSNTKGNAELKFTDEQAKFVAFQVFVNTLHQLPPSTSCRQKLYDRCRTLAENISDSDSALEMLTSHANQLLDWFVDVPFLSAIINSLLQQQFLYGLLDIQHVLVAVSRRVAELSSTSSSLTVYRAQLIRAQDLELIKANTLVAFHAFLLATKNLLTAREIARQAADSGLLIIIFEIDIPLQVHIAKLDEDRFMFPFGNVFLVRSIDLAPDDVWYAQLKCANLDFESVQEQLQVQVGVRLTWLTLGNYLCVLNHFDEAKSYYDHLLKTLSDDREALSSIYNNIGLMFAKMGDKKEALKCYDLALGLIETISSNTDPRAQHTHCTISPQSTEVRSTVSRSDVYNKMAETYICLSEPQKALDFYRKALELVNDPILRVRFEQKVQETLSLM